MSAFWGPVGEGFRSHPAKTTWMLLWCIVCVLTFIVCTFVLAAPILFLDKREEWISFWYRMWGID